MLKRQLLLVISFFYILSLVTAACDSGHTVTGQITMTDGTAVPGVKVVIPMGGADYYFMSDEEGTVTAAGIPDGTYTATPSREGYSFQPNSREFTVNGSNVSGVDFTAIGSMSGQPEVTLPPGYNIDDLTITVSGMTVPEKIETQESNFSFIPAGTIYEIGLAGQLNIDFGDNFAQLKFTYNKQILASQGLTENFAVFYYSTSEGKWHSVNKIDIDQDNSSVTAYVNHFTPFVLTAIPAPPAGGTAPSPVTGLAAFPGKETVTLTWTNPTDADFAGVVIRRSDISAPVLITEGEEAASIKYHQQMYEDNSVVPGTTYYYTIFTLDIDNNWEYNTESSIEVTTLQETDTVTRWSRLYSSSFGPDNSYLCSINQVSDGGYIASGMAGPEGGNTRIWAMRINRDNSVIWERTYGPLQTDRNEMSIWIEETFDGNFIMAGFGNYGMDTRAIVLKIAPNGDQIWRGNYGSIPNSYFRGYIVRQTIDRGYVLAGLSYNSEEGSRRTFVIKLFPDDGINAPAPEWEQVFTYNDNNYSEVISIQQLTGDFGSTNNGYIIAGTTGLEITQAQDLWIQKINPDGSADWSITYDNSYYDIATSIQASADGGYYISGSTGEETAEGMHYDAWVLKTNSAGEIDGTPDTWSYIFDNPDDDPGNPGQYIIFRAQQTYDRGIVLAGMKGDDQSNYDFWLMKLDQSGAKEWSESYDSGTGISDNMLSMIQTYDGGFALAGSSLDNSDSSIPRRGWILKLDERGKLTE